MLFDVIVVASVAGAIWWWAQRRPLRQARHARGRDGISLLTYEDLPPVGAFEPVPDEAELDDYIAAGMDRLTSYLSGRDQTA